MEVRIAPNAHELAALCAGTLGRWLAEGGSLGLAGGGTPQATYEAVRDQPIPWGQVTLWMTDERWVPTHHEDSNTAMAISALAEHVPATLLEVPEVGEGDPATAAKDYDAILGEAIGDSPNVVLLGMGGDGHTASLFPGTDALEVAEGRYVANYVGTLDTWRLTATLPYLQPADEMDFIVTGEAKSSVVAAIIDGGSHYPTGLVAEGAGNVTWFLDAAAASAI